MSDKTLESYKKKYIGKIVTVTNENIDGTNEYEFLESILNKEMIIEDITNLYDDLSIPTFKMKFKENNEIVKKEKKDDYFPFVESDFKILMAEKSTEQMIQEKNLNAPRLTPDLIQSKIVKEQFFKLTDVLTVCVLTLENGFTVTGESACASPANYNQEIGEKIAKENATEKIWMLEGYLLKQKLFEGTI